MSNQASQPNSVNILSEYQTRDELATQLDRSIRTLERWEQKRAGPPITYIGKTPYYRIKSTQAWLKSLEQKPARRAR